MSQILTISVADSVLKEVNDIIIAEQRTNKSEFCEDILRLGLLHYQKDLVRPEKPKDDPGLAELMKTGVVTKKAGRKQK